MAADCKHTRHVVWSPLRRRWRARCICGFTGPWEKYRDDAVVGGAVHALAQRLRADGC